MTKLYPTCKYGEIAPMPYVDPPECIVRCSNGDAPGPYCPRTFMTDGKV